MIIEQVIDVDSKTASSIRSLLELEYYGNFSSEDWEHTFGNQHYIGLLDNIIVAHGSVVPRNMFINGQGITVGYVEAITVLPAYWRQGFGTQLMTQITQFCHNDYELTMLSTHEKQFYEKLGWRQFLGASFVRIGELEVRTAKEDEGLMLLSRDNCGTSEIRRATCQPRIGDDW